MPRLAPVVPLLVALAAAFAFACGSDTPATSRPEELATAARVEVRIGDLVIDAEPARTGEERALGLGGRESMADEEGMLFFQGEERIPSFTMRGMLFPLDFIWISADLRVADVTENVPHQALSGELISGIQPDVAALYVLEVNAGIVEAFGIEVGVAVTLTAAGP